MSKHIRKVEKEDIPELKKVLDSSELFPSDLLDDIIQDYFDNPETTDQWFTAVSQQRPIAIAYCAPERMTEGTYNLYAIAVHKAYQGKGVGRKIIAYIEHKLISQNNRILLVETSGKPEYELTREFYIKCDYVHQATIPEFYEEGDDKVVFWKKKVK